jgi:molybdopterin synthase catalytic subunit
MSAPESRPPTSFAQILVTPLGDIAELTYDSLDDNQRICQIIDSVRRDDAGAIAVFLGTTRDNFQGEVEALCAHHISVDNEFTQPIILYRSVFRFSVGRGRGPTSDKIVTRLEYQAYTPLAIKTMVGILSEAHSLHAPQSTSTSASTPALRSKSFLKSIVVHRLGSVPVGQTSIIIAVSSPHRRQAFEACEWLLDRVKTDVQVWKREWYANAAPQQSAAENGEIGPAVGRDGEAGVMGIEAGADFTWKANSQ